MEWISVKDELPEDSTKVFCLSIHKMVYAAWFIKDDIEFFPYAHGASDVPIGSVTHWMPLPEPPNQD